MDILDEGFGAQTESVIDMNSLVETRPLDTNVPLSSVRNRAATTALLTSEPTDMVEKYRRILLEDSEGSDVTYQQASDKLAQENKSNSMKHIVSILGDNTIPLEQKKRIMNVVQDGQFREEGAITLQSKALIAGVDGESAMGEAARISLSDTMFAMQKDREDTQRLVNGFAASLPSIQTTDEGDVSVAGGLGFAADVSSEVLPFGRNIVVAKVAGAIGEKTGVENTIGAWVKNFLLPGSTKKEVRERLNNVPIAKRQEFVNSMLSSIKESAAVFPSDNYYQQQQAAVALLDSPEASDNAVWVENAFTLLDAFWVGSELRALGKGIKGGAEAIGEASRARRPGSVPPGTEDAAFTDIHRANWELVDDPHNPFAKRIGEPKLALPSPVIADKIDRIGLNSVVHRENPAAPYSVIAQANPQQARALHDAIVQGTDEIAEALTGVSREQAIINNIMPQVGTSSGRVSYKVAQEIIDKVQDTGATRFTSEEFAGAVTKVSNDFRNASGLQINDAMTTIRVDGDAMVINAHYSTPGGSFSTPAQAKERAAYALRAYGVREDEITVMTREGIDYAPYTGAPDVSGDYIVKIETRHDVRDTDVQAWNPLSVRKNQADKISQTMSDTHGSLTRNLFDPGSILHPTLTGSAATATDQSIVLENVLLEPIRGLRDAMSSLPRNRRAAVLEEMREGNETGELLNRLTLRNKGFDDDEVDMFFEWKNIWDGHYYLENFDLVRTLRSQGYELFETPTQKLIAKNVRKDQNIRNVYDPSTDSVVSLSIKEMDDLYARGGSYASFRRPIEMNGKATEHMIVRNNPGEFLRGLRDTDTLLNYRERYYTVNYLKGSKFIDEITTASNGVESRKTIGVASNTRDAEMFRDGLPPKTGVDYRLREDSRGFAKDGDGYWDLNEASGRISQRIRGKPLQSPVGINQIGTGVHVEGPLDSAVRAAKSLSGRTVTRPMLDTAKARFLDQYKWALQPDVMGRKSFPNSISELVDPVSHTSKRLADARTTYEYIRFLERGYINSADEIFKGGMNILANELGRIGLGKAEELAMAIGDVSPTHKLKATVFHAYIAMANPMRQWIVQTWQTQRLAGYNPIGFANGGIAARAAGFLAEMISPTTVSKATKEFVAFVERSGMVAGVDRNSLVRGMGIDMADSSFGIQRAASVVASVPQRIGFDTGEKLNQLMHLAAVHEKWSRTGVDMLDKTNMDLALQEARALSYDLNKAGELAYTQGSAAFLLQFLQMPHKAFLWFTNRKIAVDVKLRTAGFDLLMYGAPVGLVGAIMLAAGADEEALLPDNPRERALYQDGIMMMAFNKAFNLLDDGTEETQLDTTALRAYDLDGWAKMFKALTGTGGFGMLSASPAGQLFGVNGVMGATRDGRITQAVMSMGRYFNVIEEIDPDNPAAFTAVLNDVAKITSGWSAADNALIMLEIRKKLSSTGAVIDSSITNGEIAGAFLGFGTKATKDLYEISRHRSESKKAHQEEVKRKFNAILQNYKVSFGTDNPDTKHMTAVSSMLMRTFDNPTDRATVYRMWGDALIGPEKQLLKQMVDATTMPKPGNLPNDIKNMPVDEATKEKLLNRYRAAQEQYNKIEEKRE